MLPKPVVSWHVWWLKHLFLPWTWSCRCYAYPACEKHTWRTFLHLISSNWNNEKKVPVYRIDFVWQLAFNIITSVGKKAVVSVSHGFFGNDSERAFLSNKVVGRVSLLLFLILRRRVKNTKGACWRDDIGCRRCINLEPPMGRRRLFNNMYVVSNENNLVRHATNTWTTTCREVSQQRPWKIEVQRCQMFE